LKRFFRALRAIYGFADMSLKNLLLASTALCIPMGVANVAMAADTVYDSGSSTVVSADTADVGGNYIIGDTGTATLTVTDSGSLTTDVDIYVGSAINSNGTLVVNGGSLSANRYYIGLNGIGALTLTDGASLAAVGADRKVYLGYFGNSSGTLDLAGIGTTLTAYDLNIGWTGNGTATISGGATATIEQDVTLSKNSYTTGALTITDNGSSVTSDRLYVGESATGTLNILDGGSYTVTGTSKAYLGWNVGSSGSVTISGANSSLTADYLSAGWNGDGTMTISDGGTAAIATDAFIAYYGSSTSSLTVTGDGSSLTSDRLYVGMSGDASLYILDGGSVQTTGTNKTYVGYVNGGEGYAEISGNGSSLQTGDLNVGWGGAGAMLVKDGGSVSATGAISVGYYSGSSGTLTVANGGIVTGGGGAGTLSIAEFAGSTGSVIVGAAAGETAVAAGTFDVASIAFGAGDGTLVFNHTDTGYDFTAALSGAGTVDIYSGTTILSADSSGFSGTSEVHGGTLSVTGMLGGTLNIDDGGELVGTGTVGTTTVASGGTISPGLSGQTGTLNVNGDLTLSAGSIYVLNLDGGSSDLVNVTGTATIGGSNISVSSLDSTLSYKSGQTYTIVSAATSLTGTFSDTFSGSLADAVNKSAFLDLSTTYDSNNAYLTVAAKSTDGGVFTAAANTSNQYAVAGALDTLEQSGGSLSLYNSILVMNADEARKAYQQLSGDAYAGQQSAIMQSSSAVNAAINNRIRSAFDGVGVGSVPVLGYAEEKAQKTDGPFASYEARNVGRIADPDRFGLWSAGFGSWGSTDGLDGASGTDSSTGGFMIGADGMISRNWRAGVFFGHSSSAFDTDESSADSDNNHLGAYAGTEVGRLSLRSGMSYAWYDVDTTRSVSALNQTLTSSYDAASFNVFGELGYRFDFSESSFEPLAGLAYTHLKTDGFSESGGTAALTVDGSTMDTTYTTLGMRASHNLDLGGVLTVARGTLSWLHAFGDVDPTSTARFATGNRFTVTNTPIARDTALIEAGLDFKLDNGATVSVGYSGQFGENASENGVNAKLRVQF
jgi:outer membrane autotransporter protein